MALENTKTRGMGGRRLPIGEWLLRPGDGARAEGVVEVQGVVVAEEVGDVRLRIRARHGRTRSTPAGCQGWEVRDDTTIDGGLGEISRQGSGGDKMAPMANLAMRRRGGRSRYRHPRWLVCFRQLDDPLRRWRKCDINFMYFTCILLST